MALARPQGRDSRLRGNDGALGIYGDGAAPRLWRYGAEWILAYAGMTARGRFPLSRE